MRTSLAARALPTKWIWRDVQMVRQPCLTNVSVFVGGDLLLQPMPASLYLLWRPLAVRWQEAVYVARSDAAARLHDAVCLPGARFGGGVMVLRTSVLGASVAGDVQPPLP